MPYGYFLYEDGTFTDFMDWQVIPGEAPQGATWTAGKPHGLSEHVPVSLKSLLNKEFEQLPEALQIAFAPLEAAVNLALEQGKVWKVVGIIETAQVPESLSEYANLASEFRNKLLSLAK